MDTPKILTPKLRELVRLAANGFTDKAIAAEMFIKPSTVESHWKRLRVIYKTSSRTKIVASALVEALASVNVAMGDERARIKALETQIEDLITASGKAAVTNHNKGASFRQNEYSTALEQGLCALPILVWKCEPDVSATPAFVSNSVSRYGYSPGEFVSGLMTLATIIDESDYKHLVRQGVFPRSDVTTKVTSQYRIVSASGNLHWILERSKPLTSAGSDLLGHHIIMLDITELVEENVWPLPAQPMIIHRDQISAPVSRKLSEL